MVQTCRPILLVFTVSDWLASNLVGGFCYERLKLTDWVSDDK